MARDKQINFKVTAEEAEQFEGVAEKLGLPLAAMIRRLVRERHEVLYAKPLRLNFTVTELKPGELYVQPADASSLAYSSSHANAIDQLLAQHAAGINEGGRTPKSDDIASRALFAVSEALQRGGVIQSREDLCSLGWRANSPAFSGKVKTIAYRARVEDITKR